MEKLEVTCRCCGKTPKYWVMYQTFDARRELIINLKSIMHRKEVHEMVPLRVITKRRSMFGLGYLLDTYRFRKFVVSGIT